MAKRYYIDEKSAILIRRGVQAALHPTTRVQTLTKPQTVMELPFGENWNFGVCVSDTNEGGSSFHLYSGTLAAKPTKAPVVIDDVDLFLTAGYDFYQIVAAGETGMTVSAIQGSSRNDFSQCPVNLKNFVLIHTVRMDGPYVVDVIPRLGTGQQLPDMISLDFNDDGDFQIFQFDEGLPLASKSLAQLLVGDI